MLLGGRILLVPLHAQWVGTTDLAQGLGVIDLGQVLGSCAPHAVRRQGSVGPIDRPAALGVGSGLGLQSFAPLAFDVIYLALASHLELVSHAVDRPGCTLAARVTVRLDQSLHATGDPSPQARTRNSLDSPTEGRQEESNQHRRFGPGPGERTASR